MTGHLWHNLRPPCSVQTCGTILATDEGAVMLGSKPLVTYDQDCHPKCKSRRTGDDILFQVHRTGPSEVALALSGAESEQGDGITG